MVKRLTTVAAAVLCVFVSGAKADEDLLKATTYGSDMSGQWFIPAESGWGVNIVQQGRTMFVTLFVYGTDNRPIWYVGSDISHTSTEGSTAVYSGALYQTTGPYFGSGTFNAGSVGVAQVGTMTLRASTSIAAQLSYTVNGVSVTKNIVQQNWRTNDLSGTYIGGVSGASATCSLPLPQASANLLTLTITHNITASTATMVMNDVSNNRCTASGTVTQYGKQSLYSGTYTCTNGAARTFALGQLEAGVFGLIGFYADLSTSGCAANVSTLGAARVR